MKRISINANPEAKFSKDYFFLQKKGRFRIIIPPPPLSLQKVYFLSCIRKNNLFHFGIVSPSLV